MDYFKSFIILLFLSSIFYLYILSIINYKKYIVPQVATFDEDIKILKKILEKYNLNWKRIIDFWSWSWKMLRFFEKNFQMKTIWYEIDLFNVLVSKILNYTLNFKSKIIKWNYLDSNLENIDFIYVYLFPEIIEKVENKIFTEAEKWTIVIVNAFKFKNLKPQDIYKKNWKDKFFIYII